MSLEHLRTSLLGLPLQVSPSRRNHHKKPASFVRGECSDRSPNPKPSVFGQEHKRGVLGPFFGGRRCIIFPVGNLSLRNSRMRMNCTNETFSRSRALVRSLSPLWKEGLLFVRCSIFFAVLSAAAMVVWYGQLRARSFIQSQFMPSICSMLSEYLQRELDFGRVRSISPLGITLQSCSIGPHSEEFSCGELPTMKLRVRPFTSLRRGKIVIDAVLSRPSILIAQKEDFSWLGIPSPSEDDMNRHSSCEEGIDYRTKARRLAREDAVAKWYRDRSAAAREAAEVGYNVPQECSDIPMVDDFKNGSGRAVESVNVASFFCMDDRLHRRDHHSVDLGMEYALKHSELEKSFGINIDRKGFKFWPSITPRPLKRKINREAGRKLMPEADITYKQRNLQRSAAAALAYFRDLDDGNIRKSSAHQGDSFPVLDSANEEVIAPIMDEMVRKTINDPLDIFEQQKSDELAKSVGNEDEKDIIGESPANGAAENDVIHGVLLEQSNTGTIEDGGSSECKHHMKYISTGQRSDGFSFVSYPFLTIKDQLIKLNMPIKSFRFNNTMQKDNHAESGELSKSHETGDVNPVYIVDSREVHDCAVTSSSGVEGPLLEALQDNSEGIMDKSQESTPKVLETHAKVNNSLFMWFPNLKLGPQLANHLKEILANCLANQIQSIKLYISMKADDLASKFTEGVDLVRAKGIQKSLPVTLDSVYFTDGTLLLLGYGDQEPREMDNVDGHVKFQNHYTRVHVQLSGNCREWRSDDIYNDGGQLSTNVFVDIVDQKWHANLKIENLFAPLFERILELPVAWSKGRASGEVHLCMSGGETFPNLHGQLDVHDLAFQILDAPSCFSEITANLCFRGQRVFLHNASGRFGDVPLEASGDFGINPEEGEFHLMCQVPCVEANSLMKTLKTKPLIFSLAGSVTAVFNCQGPLDAPVFVGSGIISRKTPHLVSTFPPSPASETVNKNKEAGAVAAFDHIPFLHVSANFTFNTDNCVADLYGMRANLLDGGEIRGAGNAWICPEGEVDDSAMDVNLSGNLFFDKVIYRYIPTVQLLPLKIGELNGETKLSGSLLKPRFDIKWAAPKAEESFADARGDVIISHDYITINSSSVAFDLYTKIQTSYPDEHWQNSSYLGYRKSIPLTVEGVDLDLRMRGFEFSSLFFSNPFDSPRPVHLKATGKIKFLGKVVKPSGIRKKVLDKHVVENEKATSLVGEVSLTGIKLNQLMLAPQLGGSLAISHQEIKLDATGRPDESMSIEVAGPLWPSSEEVLQNKTLFSVLLQKGQLRAIIHYQPHHLANIEVRNLPLDELELASLRGTIQRAELQLNFQKRRGHGLLSVLHPKFSGVLGEALDVAARWSGDVITIEKTVLEQAFSHYEIQGEYVLPGTRDRYSSYKERDGLLKKALDGHLGSVISSMGRWRMRLEVPHAEVAEMLPLARLLSRSIDPAVHSRSKDFFMQSVQAMGFYAESLRGLLEAIQRNITGSDDIVIEEIALPGLAELRGHWRGSLDASGGGDGDTTAEFDFRGEDWEWGSYKSQRVLAVGAYSNNNGLRLDNMFIQKDNATLHADGTVLGPITNLHFAVLNFPVGLVPAVAQVIESSTSDLMGSLWQLLAPMKGILHMEGDLRGNLSKPECDVQVRLLDGAVGGFDLGRAEVVASMTPNSRFLFNANFEPATQSGHVHVQGSVPITYVQNDTLEEEGKEKDLDRLQTSGWVKDNVRGSIDENEKKISRDRVEDGWDAQLAEGLKGLNWNLLDDGEVRIDADIKDGGMTLLTALCPHASWIHGYADINLQVRGTVEQPVVDGSASFHRASVSSPVLQKPLTNLGGTIHVKSNRLCIISMESRVSRKGKLVVKGNLPLKTSESSIGDKIALKCEVFEVRAKNVFSGQVDSQMQITGSILQPNISGKIKLSHGEAYLPHDKGNGDAINRLASKKSSFPTGSFSKSMPSGHVSRFFGSDSASSPNRLSQHSGKQDDVEKAMDQNNPGVDVRLSDLRVFLGPELRILYPLILNFAVSGELELNGMARPKLIRPKGVLTFENGDVNLVATQVRLKRDHLNVAKFEPDLGLDPTLDLALVGSEWQFRIQSPASKWQDSLVVTSTRSVDQDVLSPTEAAKVFENQLAESLLESDGQLAFKKLATATLETLMPKIEGKGEFGQARWRLVYAPQIPSLLSVDPTADPLKSLANNISFGTEVEVQLGKRLQASVVRQMKDSEMAMQWTLVYQLTSRLRVLFQSSPSTRLLFEYSATSQN